MRICPACDLQQDHSYPYCKKCGAALDPVATLTPAPGGILRTCPGCGAEQRHSHAFCKKCGTALDQTAATAPRLADAARICPLCGAEQRHSHPFCSKCGEALSGVPTGGPAPLPRCDSCGSLRDPNWHFCESCGASDHAPIPSHHWLLWTGLAAFTVAWLAGGVYWWYFTYRVILGPLISGSAIEIDGKRIVSLSTATDGYSTPPLSRGFHTLTVTAPGHMSNELDFRIGWTGLRRHVTLAQAPEIACVTLTGPPTVSVTVGARWAGDHNQNEFCAPVGTHAIAQWQPDATQPPLRQPFEYAIDGQMVALSSAPSVTEKPVQASLTPTAVSSPAPPAAPVRVDPAASRQRAQQLVQTAQTLFTRLEYKSALTTCNQALTLDPGNQEALRLQSQIRQTMQVLGIQP